MKTAPTAPAEGHGLRWRCQKEFGVINGYHPILQFVPENLNATEMNRPDFLKFHTVHPYEQNHFIVAGEEWRIMRLM